jgi:hypothetical protein
MEEIERYDVEKPSFDDLDLQAFTFDINKYVNIIHNYRLYLTFYSIIGLAKKQQQCIVKRDV